MVLSYLMLFIFKLQPITSPLVVGKNLHSPALGIKGGGGVQHKVIKGRIRSYEMHLVNNNFQQR